MPISLRRRPICHYCGKRNKPLNDKRFQCQHCLADNFIDEDGQLADVPPDTAASPKQYARRVHSPPAESPVFCQTCLKNQALYTTALSEFLPDPDDSEYDRFEAALPEFKERMEKQYPQCCIRCEPKVRMQLQQAMYNARSDRLRRVLEKSRARRVADRLGWRRLLVFVAGLGHFTSLFMQILWHFLGSQSISAGDQGSTTTACVWSWPVPATCSDLIARSLWISFALGLACIWWNPQWQSRLQGRAERLNGLSDYYRAQAGILAVRFAAWIVIGDLPIFQPYRQQIHSISLVLILLCVGYSLTLVTVDNAPLVNWQLESGPILTKGQFVPPLVTPPSSQEAFAVQELASVPDETMAPWRPPAPPDDGDEMDWDPSPVALSPQPKAIFHRSTQPTPFHGTLPRMPQTNIFSRKGQVESSQPIGIPIGFFDKYPTSQTKESEPRAQMAQPKFFPDYDRADTGLESIFSKVFSLHDEAVELRYRNSSHIAENSHASMPQNRGVQKKTFVPGRMFSAVAVAVLTPITICVLIYNSIGEFATDALSVVVTSTITIPLIGAVLALIEGAKYSKAVLYLLECVVLAALSFSQPPKQSLLMPLWHKLIIGTLSAILIQSIYNFCAQKSDPFSHRAPSDEAESIRAFEAGSAHEDTQGIEPLVMADYQSARGRRESVSSVGSVSSINSTSTASGWKTPVVNHRLDLADSSARSSQTSNAFNMGNLGINDFTFGSSVAGPRTRRAGLR